MALPLEPIGLAGHRIIEIMVAEKDNVEFLENSSRRVMVQTPRVF